MLKQIIIENIDMQVNTESIDSNSILLDLGIDSITFIKIVVAIEVKFGFEFRDEDLDANKFLKFQSIVSYVENRLN